MHFKNRPTRSLDSYLVLTGSAVLVVVAGDVLQVVHRVCPSGRERLPLGRGRAGVMVDHQRVVRVIGGTGLGVHLGHLVAVHDRRGRH